MDQAQRAKLERRLKRREVWVGLWLTRACAFMHLFAEAPMPRAWRVWFDGALAIFAKTVLTIIFARFVLCAQPLALRRGAYDPRRPRAFLSLRAMIGGRLRRLFKARRLSTRLRQILAALQNRDAHVARLSRRLRRGLSRLSSAFTRAAVSLDAIACSLSPALTPSIRAPGTRSGKVDAADTS